MPTTQDSREKIERAIIALVSRVRRIPAEKITSDTDLCVDLGIAGDDADPILQGLIEIYPHLKTVKTNIGRRFGSEGTPLWGPLILPCRLLAYPIRRWVLGQSTRQIQGLGGLGVTIRDLVDLVTVSHQAAP